MRQWLVMFAKECVENWSNLKWVWVPLVFLLLGVMQPLTSYYLPQIIDTLGGMPEGTIIEIPLPSSEAVLVETLSQYNLIGVLIIVFAVMTTISGERQSGVVHLILAKPVPLVTYITTKWTSFLSLTLVSFVIGYAGAWYYTEILFGPVDVSLLLKSAIIYMLWLAFVMTITLLFSSTIKGAGGIAFLSIAVIMVLSIISSIFDWLMEWSPATLPAHAASVLMEGAVMDKFWLSISVTILSIFAILVFAAYLFKQMLIRN